MRKQVPNKTPYGKTQAHKKSSIQLKLHVTQPKSKDYQTSYQTERGHILYILWLIRPPNEKGRTTLN